MNQTLTIGQKFDTAHEKGCIVTSLPDSVGNFTAFDSDGVECSFSLIMVVHVYTDTNE